MQPMSSKEDRQNSKQLCKNLFFEMFLRHAAVEITVHCKIKRKQRVIGHDILQNHLTRAWFTLKILLSGSGADDIADGLYNVSQSSILFNTGTMKLVLTECPKYKALNTIYEDSLWYRISSWYQNSLRYRISSWYQKLLMVPKLIKVPKLSTVPELLMVLKLIMIPKLLSCCSFLVNYD